LTKGVLGVTHGRKNEVVAIATEFDCALVESKVADQVRSAAKSIQEEFKRMIDSFNEVGNARTGGPE
jgi:hypothetical protein